MPAQRMAQALALPKGAHVLDVACGSAAWSIPFAEADPQARLTLQDFPGVLEHTKGYLTRHKVIEQSNFLPGNLREVDFGEAQFDAAVLGNIVHSEGPESSQALFAKLQRALKPGGKIVIVDMIPNEERTGPPFALIFALNMLVVTKEGGTYTLGEYTSWLQGAGFSNVETLDVGIHSPLIVATK
jgi:ubiquinone/menaquinone biosynthesis C-methylase UbiE